MKRELAALAVTLAGLAALTLAMSLASHGYSPFGNGLIRVGLHPLQANMLASIERFADANHKYKPVANKKCEIEKIILEAGKGLNLRLMATCA